MAGGACMAGGHVWQGGMHEGERHVWQGACMAGVMHGSGCMCMAGETPTAADGMHPTGMHSCLT